MLEKIEKIETIKFSDHVYDITVPKTHNFLIETGFVSSNCHDLGQELKIGAHMLELRRTKAGIFSEKDSITLYQLQEMMDEYNELREKGKESEARLNHYLIPIEFIINYMPSVEVNENSLERLYNGSPLYSEFVKDKETIKKLEKNIFIALVCKKKLVEIAKTVLEGNKIAVPETVIKN